MKIIKSGTLNDIEAKEVEVQSTFTKGLPSFTIVGLAANSIQESKDRVKSALLTNDYKFPPKKITVNLAPSEIKKSGTHFDLAIALLISLYENKKIKFEDYHIFGELSLDGKINDSSQIFPIILSLVKQNRVKKVLVCKQSAKKISKIPNIEVFCVQTLLEAINFFLSDDKKNFKYQTQKYEHKKIELINQSFYYIDEYLLNFSDVKGQENAKKASLIAAAGNHNILFEGSPGCGKSMIAKRMQYIMPPMSIDEILDIAKLQALDLKEPDFKPIRVFRNPHQSSTKASILGGNSIGEIALANNGILFFDELPYFSLSILEAMREPLEDYKLLVSRSNSKIKFDTKFLFIAAMNPCPCGNLLSNNNSCRCNELEIKRYKQRLSEPFLDRIDLYIVMNEVNKNDKSTYTSKTFHKQVLKAFIMQKQRGQKELNGKLNDEDILKYCILNQECKDIINKATVNFNLSFRSINKVLKVSRTIADLQGSENIDKTHLMEALSYRRR